MLKTLNCPDALTNPGNEITWIISLVCNETLEETSLIATDFKEIFVLFKAPSEGPTRGVNAKRFHTKRQWHNYPKALIHTKAYSILVKIYVVKFALTLNDSEMWLAWALIGSVSAEKPESNSHALFPPKKHASAWQFRRLRCTNFRGDLTQVVAKKGGMMRPFPANCQFSPFKLLLWSGNHKSNGNNDSDRIGQSKNWDRP